MFICAMTQDFEGSSSYMSRSPLAISAAGGSFFTLAWQILSEKLQEPIFDQPVCNCPLIDFKPRFHIDWISLICGILIGLLLGPIIETLCLLRQLWAGIIRRQLLGGNRSGPLYRLL